MMKQNTMRIRSQPCELAAVRDCLELRACEIGFSSDDVSGIILAVDEALANVIRHGYGGACEKPIDVEIGCIEASARAGICILIRDYGKQVDPADIVGRPLEDVRPGGLGVHIIRSIMDEVDYRPADGGGMLLTMKKSVQP